MTEYDVQDARSHGRIKLHVNEAAGEVHNFRCKLTTCKCQELHAPGKQPGRRMHASYKYVPGTKQKEECCIVLRLELIKGKSFAHHPLLVAVYFLWRGRFDFFVGFENTASYR